jgi:hypothetical protein
VKTPIAPHQLNRAQWLLNQAAVYLEQLTEERLNLDTETRDAINRARGEVSESERLLLEQPVTR